MSDEKQPELEFDVIENYHPRPKVFTYEITFPNSDKKNIGIIAYASDDARVFLSENLPEGSSILRLGVILDQIVQV